MRRKKIKKDLPDEKSFGEQIEQTVKDLYYISETDSEIFPYVGKKADEVSAAEILKHLGKNDQVEERDFYDFFSRLTKYQDWFGDEEKKTADNFSELKKILTLNLIEKKVFKIGQINVDIYIVGLDENNVLTGVWTKAVET